MGALPKTTRMTVDEFLGWAAGEPNASHWQLIDGEPVAMAPASDRHGAIIGELGRLLGNHLLARGAPCQIIVAPGVIPRVRARENYRIPDLGVTCAPPAGGMSVAEPVLLIEVLSPGNERATRANIWTYTTIPSVQEILALRSTRIEAELLRRDAAGHWPDAPEILRPPADLELASIGCSLPLADIYRTSGLPL